MQVILCALGDRRKWPTLVFTRVTIKSHFKSVSIYYIFLKTNWFLFLNDVRRYCTWNLLIMVLNCRNVDNFGVAVASSSKRERPSVKTAYIRLRIDIFEEFTIDYNLTAYTGGIKKLNKFEIALIWCRIEEKFWNSNVSNPGGCVSLNKFKMARAQNLDA